MCVCVLCVRAWTRVKMRARTHRQGPLLPPSSFYFISTFGASLTIPFIDFIDPFTLFFLRSLLLGVKRFRSKRGNRSLAITLSLGHSCRSRSSLFNRSANDDNSVVQDRFWNIGCCRLRRPAMRFRSLARQWCIYESTIRPYHTRNNITRIPTVNSHRMRYKRLKKNVYV